MHGLEVQTPKLKMYSVDAQTWSYFVLVFGIMGLVLYGCTTFCLVVSFIYAKIVLVPKTEIFLEADDLNGVSIIKPLMGVDPFLETNLESHFKLNYSKFELLFCLQDKDDPAIDLIKKLQDKYPNVMSKIFISNSEQTQIINPMVNNMAPAYDAALYDYVWISTSRIKVSTEILIDMLSKLQKSDVALVHQMPFVTDQSGFAGALEKVYFGCAMARYYLSLNAIGLCCTTGMSYIFKKSILEQYNGLVWYGQFLAEDYFLTNKIHQAGYKLVLSSYPAQQNVAFPTIHGFIVRMVRWTRLRINMMTFVTCFVEPAADCFPVGLWGAWSFQQFFDVNPYTFIIVHIICWIARDYLQLSDIQKVKLPFSLLYFVFVWTVRELLQTVIFLISIVKPHEIRWGQRKYHVQLGGLTKIVMEKECVNL